MSTLTKQDIKRLFEALNKSLEEQSVCGEIYLVGGAVMCLVFDARAATHDVDAFFQPSKIIRQAALRIARDLGYDASWLNDSVKGYLSEKGTYASYKDLSHLKIFVAQPAYLLAMKCLAMRIGEEFHDVDDIRYLLRNLDIQDYPTALDTITQYYPLEHFPQKTLYALDELLS